MSPYQGHGVWKDKNMDYMPLRLVKLRVFQFMKRYEDLSDMADGNRNFANQIMLRSKNNDMIAQSYIGQARIYERQANWCHRVAKLYSDALEERTSHVPVKVSFT
jgi:hypothetical protein